MFTAQVKYGWIILLTATAAMAQRAPLTGDGSYQTTSYPESYVSTFNPMPELRLLPPARADAVAARSQLRRAQSSLTSAIDDVRITSDVATDLNAATAEQRAAYETLVAARAQAGDVDFDVQVEQARQRLVAAGKRVAELRRQFEISVRLDPQVRAARKSIAAARTAALAADAFYLEARKVAGASLDYGYFVQNRPRPYSTYPYYGYASPPLGYPFTWRND